MDQGQRRVTNQAIWIKADRDIRIDGDRHTEAAYQSWMRMIALDTLNVYGKPDFWVNGFKALVF